MCDLPLVGAVPLFGGPANLCAILSPRSSGARVRTDPRYPWEPMTETLTESFCERCGTRYTFESARPRGRLKGVKVLSRGLKNFVLSDDTSMDEAMAAARSETDREATAHQLDAFHKTFNFCMSCRQYTCPNCWNEPEARCLTCAPLALPEAPAVVDDLRAFQDAFLTGEPIPGNGAVHDHDAQPAAATEDEEAEPPVAAGAEPAVAAEAEPPALTDAAGKAAAQTTGLLRRFRPGQSLDAELDAFERERGDAAAAGDLPGPAASAIEEPVSPAAASAALGAGAGDASLSAEPSPETLEPTPVEALTGPSDALAPEPEPQPFAAAPGDFVEQPTWRITAPDASGTPAAAPTPPVGDDTSIPLQAGAPPATPSDGEPQWPARPQWPSATPAAGLPFLGRPAAPKGGIEALWAASNQELVTAAPAPQGRTAGGIQPCISCGLSLSATARFCRRCGTLQGR